MQNSIKKKKKRKKERKKFPRREPINSSQYSKKLFISCKKDAKLDQKKKDKFSRRKPINLNIRKNYLEAARKMQKKNFRGESQLTRIFEKIISKLQEKYKKKEIFEARAN